MKGGALALIGTSSIPAFLSRSVLAEVTTAVANKKKLVVLFQRGAVDGLNVVVPYQEKNYYAMRPTIAIKQNEVIDLDEMCIRDRTALVQHDAGEAREDDDQDRAKEGWFGQSVMGGPLGPVSAGLPCCANRQDGRNSIK